MIYFSFIYWRIGSFVQVTIRFENGKWIQVARFANGKEMVAQRWVDDQDQLHVVR